MTQTTTSLNITEMLIKNTYNSYKDRLNDLTIGMENETIRLLQNNNLTELTFANPVPIVIADKLIAITAIRIDTTSENKRYYELEFKFSLTDTFVKADDYAHSSNLFRFPYMEILMETINTLFPNALD